MGGLKKWDRRDRKFLRQLRNGGRNWWVFTGHRRDAWQKKMASFQIEGEYDDEIGSTADGSGSVTGADSGSGGEPQLGENAKIKNSP